MSRNLRLRKEMTAHASATLAPRVAALRAISDDVQPDVEVFDHSPTALLACIETLVPRAPTANDT
jgi:hypothetical protein